MSNGPEPVLRALLNFGSSTCPNSNVAERLQPALPQTGRSGELLISSITA